MDVRVFLQTSIIASSFVVSSSSGIAHAQTQPRTDASPAYRIIPLRVHLAYEYASVYGIPDHMRNMLSYQGVPAKLSDTTGGMMIAFGLGIEFDIRDRFDVALDASYHPNLVGSGNAWSKQGGPNGFNHSDDYVGYSFSGWSVDLTGAYRFYPMVRVIAGARYQSFELRNGVDAWSAYTPKDRAPVPHVQPIIGASFTIPEDKGKMSDSHLEIAILGSPSLTQANGQAQVTLIQVVMRVGAFPIAW